MGITNRLAQIMTVQPDAEAIAQDDRWDSWRDVDAVGRAIEEHLRDLPAGAAVGLISRNRVGVVSALLGLLARRRAVVTLNHVQPDSALAAEIQQLRPAVLVAAEEDWQRPGVEPAARSAGTLGLVVERGPAAGARVVHRPVEGPASDCFRAGDDCAIVLKTSGTTGPPKRVELTYRSLSASIAAVQKHHGAKDAHEVRLRPGVTIQMLPLAHTSAIQSVCTTVADGRRLILLDRFEPHAWARAVRDYQVVTTGIPPAAIKMVLDSDIDPEWLSSLKAVRAGSAPLDPLVAEAFTARFGIPVLQAYGATEFQGLASWTLKDHRRFATAKKGAVGRIHPGVEVRVVDPETEQVLPVGSAGILEVRTAQSSTGPGEWVRTSDLARYDEDGFLWILGRVDGAINRGGFKIQPDEVAKVLREHPDVADAAVVGAPDHRLGEVPVACVELRPGAADPGEDALRAWVRGHLEAYKVPTRIRAVAMLPRTIALKPDKQAILQLVGADDALAEA